MADEVKYGKEVLISTGQYENVKIKFERSVTLREGEDASFTSGSLRKFVNRQIIDEIVAMKTGEVTFRREAEEQKIRRKYGLID